MGIYRRLTTTDGADSAILTTSDTYMTVTADSYELEDLQITPKIEAQKFKSNKYGYNSVFVSGIKGEDIEVTPGTEDRTFNGVYRHVTVQGDENLIPENIKKGAKIGTGILGILLTSLLISPVAKAVKSVKDIFTSNNKSKK